MEPPDSTADHGWGKVAYMVAASRIIGWIIWLVSAAITAVGTYVKFVGAS